jgi:hypothetical protein
VKKVILSVIAVFTVQAGFIALTSIDRQTDEEAKATPVISGPSIGTGDLIAEIASTDSGEEPAELTQTINVRTVYSPGRNNNINPGRRGPSSKQVSNAVTAGVADFEPIVISIKPASIRPQPEQPQVAASKLDQTEKQAFSVITKRSKKRSFFSKSMSVIKTPYRWIKSLGSKIL